jgi:hypothetical protein
MYAIGYEPIPLEMVYNVFKRVVVIKEIVHIKDFYKLSLRTPYTLVSVMCHSFYGISIVVYSPIVVAYLPKDIIF